MKRHLPLGECGSSESVGNPFATRWVRPGAVPYFFSDGGSIAHLLAKFAAHHWRGAIIGPHGSGKTTLLIELARAIENSGREFEMIALHDGQRRLPRRFWRDVKANSGRLIVIDGFEQLSWWSRQRLLWRLRRYEGGLLVTAHRTHAAAGLPIIRRTSAEVAIAQHIVERCLPSHGGWIDSSDVAAAFDNHRGNVREVLFALYERFEQRRLAQAPAD